MGKDELVKSLDFQEKDVFTQPIKEQIRNYTSVKGRDRSVGLKKKKRMMIDTYGETQSINFSYASTGRQGAFGHGRTVKRASLSSKKSKQYAET